ncbi:MAG: hypothetical protein ACI855_002554 [Myxococcota bacterium]|jgi:hypothetical protein
MHLRCLATILTRVTVNVHPEQDGISVDVIDLEGTKMSAHSSTFPWLPT